MKAAWGLILAGSAMLLGSASPPVRAPLLAVDPSVFDAEPGCPEGAEACIVLTGGTGEIVLAGLPRPAAPETGTASASAPASASAADGRPAPGSLPRVLDPVSPIRVVVSLPQQKAYVFRRGALVATAPVSTGRPGHPTPVGTFRILQKQVHHHSNRYSNAPMPFMQRLTNYGIALHAGALPGYPASHGCIRLPWRFARQLYGMTDGNTRVTITRERLRLAARELA
jgi:hypothetical protein